MHNISVDSVHIMGILNVTPDSFYKNNSIDYINKNPNFLKYSDIIDVGCESSRPFSSSIDLNTELKRLSTFIESNNMDEQYLSIDTYKPEVAKFALQNGFSMINDIKSGGDDNAMFHIAAEYDCPLILMHMKGDPSNMQIKPYYENVIDEIISFFEIKLEIAYKCGLRNENIILDPGIGFGKRIEDNDSIILNLSKIKQFELPLLVGLSRKSFLSIDNDEPESRLPSTLAATVLAIQNGANILRVHDVLETYKIIKTIKRINKNEIRELNEV